MEISWQKVKSVCLGEKNHTVSGLVYLSSVAENNEVHTQNDLDVTLLVF